MKKTVLFAVLVLFVFSAVSADKIILKDEQVFEADVTGFDEYYLEVTLENGKEISIPWAEVRYVKHTTTASSWLEETYMTDEDVEVKTYVSPLDPGVAVQKAFFPGILTHGSGHLYARDKEKGVSLLSAEILSVIIMGLSVMDVITHDTDDRNTGITKGIFCGGLAIFTGTWLYDIIFAPGAVNEFNKKHDFYLETGKDKDEKENTTEKSPVENNGG